MQRMFTLGGLSRAGFGAVLGAAVLLGAPRAWSQETQASGDQPQAEAKDDAARAGREPRREERSQATGARGEQSEEGEAQPGGGCEFHDPIRAYHTYSVRKEREEVEILEAQLAAKRAHIRLAEARLKQVQDQLAFYKQKGGSDPEVQEKVAMIQAELPVLEAEHDAELAEIREPQVLLQHAKRWLEHLERIGRQSGYSGRGRMFGQMGMGMMPPMGGRGSMAQINEQLEQLRSQVEGLRRQLESLGRESR